MRTIHNEGSLLLVPVSINGKGPYEFLLDTASPLTLVDAPLYKELGLAGRDSLRVDSTVGTATAAAIAHEVSLGGIRMNNILVTGIEDLKIGDGKRHIRGVLGENFLAHFDILIDNAHDEVLFDDGSNLASSYEGQRLPMAGGRGSLRPTIEVAVNSFDPAPIKLALNSGTNAVGIYPEKGSEWKVRAVAGARRSAARSGHETRRCTTWKDGLSFGSERINGVDIYACDGVTQEQADVQGNLPTSIFQGILISHSQAFVIVNPVKETDALVKGVATFASRQ